MDKQVEELIPACYPSQLVGPRAKPEPVRSIRLPEGPWQDISIDLLDISDGEHLLVVVDYRSRWMEAILLKKADAQHVIKSMEAIFRTHGLPGTVRSDDGPPFELKEFEAFLEYLGIEHKKGVPYWPQSNGEVERCNETLLKLCGFPDLKRETGGRPFRTFCFSTELLHILLPECPLQNCLWGGNCETNFLKLNSAKSKQQSRISSSS